MRRCLAIEVQAMAIEAPGQFGIVREPARVGQRNEVEAERGIGRIGVPETLVAAKIGQAGIDAHAGACTDQQGIRCGDCRGRTIEKLFMVHSSSPPYCWSLRLPPRWGVDVYPRMAEDNVNQCNQ